MVLPMTSVSLLPKTIRRHRAPTVTSSHIYENLGIPTRQDSLNLPRGTPCLSKISSRPTYAPTVSTVYRKRFSAMTTSLRVRRIFDDHLTNKKSRFARHTYIRIPQPTTQHSPEQVPNVPRIRHRESCDLNVEVQEAVQKSEVKDKCQAAAKSFDRPVRDGAGART
jgi:hypothetical protein